MWVAMKIVTVFLPFVVFFAAGACAEERFYDGGEFTPLAELQFTNRTTAVRETVYADIAAPLEYDDMTVTLSRCWRATPPDEARNAAWIDVVRHAPADNETYVNPSEASEKAENKEKDVKEESLFSGWVYAESPGLSMPEHPIYSVRLLSCATERKTDAAPAPEPAENNAPEPAGEPDAHMGEDERPNED